MEPPARVKVELARARPSSVPATFIQLGNSDKTVKPELTTDVVFSPPSPAMNSVEPQEDATKREQASKVSQEHLFKGLQGIVDSGDLPKLEAGVTVAQGVLQELQKPMKDFKKQAGELNDWLASIIELSAKSKTAGRTVIAVAGGTGAGKSSLINVCPRVVIAFSLQLPATSEVAAFGSVLTFIPTIGCAQRRQASANKRCPCLYGCHH